MLDIIAHQRVFGAVPLQRFSISSFRTCSPIIGHFEGHAGYSGVMIGLPTEPFHLEFTHASGGSPCPAPTKDNLLLLYLESEQVYISAVKRMEVHGHRPVEQENPYWKDKSQTFEDPDGWGVVLFRGKPLGA